MGPPHRLTDVRLPGLDGRSIPAALAIPTEPVGGRAPAVIVIHEALGLTPEIRRIAGRFATAGYVSLAPDFLAGLGPRPLCIARFFRGVGRAATGRPYRQLDAARAWLADRPEVDASRIGLAGFCIGGGFAILWAADRGPRGARVLAPFYGAVPDDPERVLAGICPVVASYGGQDLVFRAGARRLEEALSALGVEHDVKVYPDAGHAFMTRIDGLTGWIGRRLPMRTGYHEAAAEDAWARTLAFFARHLGPAGSAG